MTFIYTSTQTPTHKAVYIHNPPTQTAAATGPSGSAVFPSKHTLCCVNDKGVWVNSRYLIPDKTGSVATRRGEFTTLTGKQCVSI